MSGGGVSAALERFEQTIGCVEQQLAVVRQGLVELRLLLEEAGFDADQRARQHGELGGAGGDKVVGAGGVHPLRYELDAQCVEIIAQRQQLARDTARLCHRIALDVDGMRDGSGRGPRD